jgi:hypothetical protein
MGSKGTHIGKWWIGSPIISGKGQRTLVGGKKLVYIEQPWTLLRIHVRTQSSNIHHVRLLCLSAVVQCFSLTTKQPQPAYKPQKQPAEQGD